MPRYMSRLARTVYVEIFDDLTALLDDTDKVEPVARLIGRLAIHPEDKAELAVDLGLTEPEHLTAAEQVDAASGTHEEITAGVDGTGPHHDRGQPPYGRWTVR
jgi:hypothetical protein